MLRTARLKTSYLLAALLLIVRFAPAGGQETGDNAPPEPATKTENVEIASELRRLGAVVRSNRDGFVTEVDFSQSKSAADILTPLRPLDKIQVLVLSGRKVDDDDLAKIGHLKNIELLVLAQAPVSDAGLAHLAKLSKLQGLDVRATKVTGSGLQHLQDCKKLRDLLLDGSQLDDQGLEQVAKLPALETVSLSGTKVSASGVRKLKRARPELAVLE